LFLTCTNISSAITKKLDNPMYIKTIALQHTDTHYQGFQRIYTDGSKEPKPNTGKTGAAIYNHSGPLEDRYRCTDNILVNSTDIIDLITELVHIHNKGNQRKVALLVHYKHYKHTKPVHATYSTHSLPSYISSHNPTNINNSSV
jgi:hypothetical protein